MNQDRITTVSSWADQGYPVPMPAPVNVVKATPADAGCWVDGVRGIYAGVAMVDIAVSRGYELAPDDASVLEWARNGYGDPDRDDWPEFWTEIQDEVTTWLDENVAPDGYIIEWCDGDLMMWSEAASCEASGDRCDDLTHEHVSTAGITHMHGVERRQSVTRMHGDDDSFAAHCEGY